MSYSRKTVLVDFAYKIGDTKLQRCQVHKDLGIVFDPALSINDHIEHEVGAASGGYGFIVRNTRAFHNISVLKSLFCSFVRSKLKYGNLIFYPLYDRLIDALEAVQRKFLKFVHFKSVGVYPERNFEQTILLRMFDLLSLRERRIKISLRFLIGLVCGEVDCADLLSVINFCVPKFQVRHTLTFYLSS